MTQSLPLR